MSLIAEAGRTKSRRRKLHAPDDAAERYTDEQSAFDPPLNSNRIVDSGNPTRGRSIKSAKVNKKKSGQMKQLALALAVTSAFAFAVPATPANAAIETYEARSAATQAAAAAKNHMLEVFGKESLKPGEYLWREAAGDGEPRVVVGLGDQIAYLYRGSELVAVSSISSGKKSTVTPTGIFDVLEKKTMHRSRKYDDAPMPFMQRIDQYGVALHAGHNPGRPASHGCVRLPSKFAAKLFQVTRVGTPVLIGG